MTYEEVERVTSPLKKASVNNNNQETKLPIKDAAVEEDNTVPYWVRVNQFIMGASA